MTDSRGDFLEGFGEPSPPSAGLSSSAGMLKASTLDNLMSGGDAEQALIDGLLRHQLVLGSSATKALAFLQAYGFGDLAESIMVLRQYHQRPSGLKDALESASLKKMVSGGVNFNVNNGS